jgi:outer membrane protein
MSLSFSNHLRPLALFVSLSGVCYAGQDPSVSAKSIDALVDEVWPANAPVDEAQSALELSLEAARSIGLANDLGLQGAAEYSEAARFRELGSWGAFDWIFSASARLEDSRLDPSTDFEVGTGVVDIDTNSRELSIGFQRAFRAGGDLSVGLEHNNSSTNSLFARNGNRDVLSAAYTRPLLRGAGRAYATSLQQIAGLRFARELESIHLQRQQLLLDIEVKYWDLVLAQRQLEVAGSALDLSIEQLQRDRRRREAGVSTDVEVIQDEATVARRIEGVLLVETALETCMDRLRSTIFPGVEQGAWSVQIRPITAMPEIAPAPAGAEWDDEIRSALTLRSEVKLAEFDVKIATALHARTASEKQSSLDLLFQVGSQGFDEGVGRSLGEALSYDSPTVAAGLSYQLPIKNTALANEERAARAEMRGARLGLDAAKSQIANEVREALRQVRYQSEASLAANKTREAAERLVTAEMTRYEQGLATTFQVLEFQQALVEAQYSERAGLTAYCQALARLEAARGQIGGNGRRSPGEIAP